MTQNEIVLRFMASHGTMSTMDAFELGITRLASRVSDLKKLGIPIGGKFVSKMTPDGVKRWKEYYIDFNT